MALLDNYEASTGRDEEVTQEEVRENRAFIDAIMETKVRLCTIILYTGIVSPVDFKIMYSSIQPPDALYSSSPTLL